MNLSCVTQTAIERLCQWWLESAEDDCDSPDWNDVYWLFDGVSGEELQAVLLNHAEPEFRAAAASALGARQDDSAMSALLEARGDPADIVRVYVWAAMALIDDWYGLYDLWDFVFVMCAAYHQLETPQRQLRMF